jgi:hypothetical protein
MGNREVYNRWRTLGFPKKSLQSIYSNTICIGNRGQSII